MGGAPRATPRPSSTNKAAASQTKSTQHLAGVLIGGRLPDVDDAIRVREIEGERARRKAARELIGRYHDEQLRLLLDHVRDGFEGLDSGELDPFELDELIHRYKRSAQKLWSFCGSSGSAWEQAALTVEWWREHGEEEPDWWTAGEPRHRRE